MLLSFLGPHLPSLCSSESQLQIYVRLQAGRSNPELGCRHLRQLQACLAMVYSDILVGVLVSCCSEHVDSILCDMSAKGTLSRPTPPRCSPHTQTVDHAFL